MDRREVLRVLGAAAVLPVLAPLSPESRLTFGRVLHARAASRALRSLSAHQNVTVTRIAEMIIPETDTPGATTARVTEFIDLLLTDWYPPEERDRFLAGLSDMDAKSRAAHGAAFIEVPADAQVALLGSWDGAAGAEGSAEDAFARLKELTLYGYFTSEVVVKEVLRTQVIPGRHDGCVPV
jgi:hypothetical protein